MNISLLTDMRCMVDDLLEANGYKWKLVNNNTIDCIVTNRDVMVLK